MKLSVHEQIRLYVEEIIEQYGVGKHILSHQEIEKRLSELYGTPSGSVTTNDYSYNWYSKNLSLNRPLFFEYMGNAQYLVLGEDYDYNGDVYAKPQGQSKHIVGYCYNGKQSLNEERNDYLNFFNMLKFWIKQTNNNIENTGKRVTSPIEINKDNARIAMENYIDPQFEPEYLIYKDFSTGMSFFRQGHYQGRYVNIVGAAHDVSLWLNLRYIKNDNHIVAVYSNEKSSDTHDFKNHMTKAGYGKDKIFAVDDLELGIHEPNEKVKELFSYYSEMINYARKYKEGGESNMKVKELATKLIQSYNIILRGAPGTGKTYLAKQIAAEIIGISMDDLSTSEQFEFVQFHPSYDYTDFVEGLRPIHIN